jgi:hypothetical protein
MKSFADKLLEMAITALVVAILLNVAWQMLQPVLPFLAGGLAIYGYVAWRRHS